MSRWRNSLSLRLALMFALVSTCLLGGIGFYLNYSLQRELVWRDDQSLLGRLEHIQALLGQSQSVVELQSRPQLYANMLGNQDSLLWVIDDQGRALISVNPGQYHYPTCREVITHNWVLMRSIRRVSLGVMWSKRASRCYWWRARCWHPVNKCWRRIASSYCSHWRWAPCWRLCSVAG